MLTTVGLDLGDKVVQACFIDQHGEIVEESRLKTTEPVLRRRFSGKRTCVELEHLALSRPGRYASFRDSWGRCGQKTADSE